MHVCLLKCCSHHMCTSLLVLTEAQPKQLPLQWLSNKCFTLIIVRAALHGHTVRLLLKACSVVCMVTADGAVRWQCTAASLLQPVWATSVGLCKYCTVIMTLLHGDCLQLANFQPGLEHSCSWCRQSSQADNLLADFVIARSANVVYCSFCSMKAGFAACKSQVSHRQHTRSLSKPLQEPGVLSQQRLCNAF